MVKKSILVCSEEEANSFTPSISFWGDFSFFGVRFFGDSLGCFRCFFTGVELPLVEDWFEFPRFEVRTGDKSIKPSLATISSSNVDSRFFLDPSLFLAVAALELDLVSAGFLLADWGDLSNPKEKRFSSSSLESSQSSLSSYQSRYMQTWLWCLISTPFALICPYLHVHNCNKDKTYRNGRHYRTIQLSLVLTYFSFLASFASLIL